MTFKFVNGVINQITRYLGIYCFSLEKRTKSKTGYLKIAWLCGYVSIYFDIII